MRTPQTRVTPHMPGAPRLMVTDHGTHPADAWAQVTAEHIAPLGPSRRTSAMVMQAKIAEVLVPHHEAIAGSEREQLAADPSRLTAAFDTGATVDAALGDIEAAAAGTEWEGHFRRDIAPALVEIRSLFAASPWPDLVSVPGDADAITAALAETEATLTAETEAVWTDFSVRITEPLRTIQRAALLRRELSIHFASSQLHERSWHADRDPSHPASAAFRAQYHAGPTP